MKQDKINPKDGQEITVFYLKDKHMEPNKESTVGAVFEPQILKEAKWKYGEPAPNQIHGKSTLHMGDAYNIDVSFFGESDMSDYGAEDSPALLIDDTIESDFLDEAELVKGRLYRIPKLNSLTVRYEGVADGGLISLNRVVLLVWHHDFPFHIPLGSLVKANKEQVKKYLNK